VDGQRIERLEVEFLVRELADEEAPEKAAGAEK
jgi:hypothetical protein